MRARIFAATLAVILSGGAASAQDKPWELFLDNLSNSACDVVNASNAQLVVLSDTFQMVIVTGNDVTLEDTVIDEQGFVFFEGDFVGTIGFADDGDGFRSLWWTSLTGTVVSVNGFTGEPTQTNLMPADFEDVACDACEFWDDPRACLNDDAPDDEPPITVSLCGADVPITVGMIGAFWGLSLMRRRGM